MPIKRGIRNKLLQAAQIHIANFPKLFTVLGLTPRTS
jgi:hypothetical protein